MQWIEEKEGGRVDTTQMKFPVEALEAVDWQPAAVEPVAAAASVKLPQVMEPPGPPPTPERPMTPAAANAVAVPPPTPTELEPAAEVEPAEEAALAAPTIDSSVEVLAPPAPGEPEELEPEPEPPAVDEETAAPDAPWGVAEAEAVVAGENPTVEECERAALLFADILETSPGDATAKAGLRTASKAKRAAKRAAAGS